jgi:hypothetical protein
MLHYRLERTDLRFAGRRSVPNKRIDTKVSPDMPRHPWTIIVLPRSETEIVLVRDVSGLIDGPADWKVFGRIRASKRNSDQQ